MLSIRILLVAFSFAVAIGSAAPITLSQFNLAVSEDFNLLAVTAGTTVPAGWTFLETGTGANTTYGAGSGNSATGDTYSFGTGTSSDRAFGTLRTASLVSTFGVAFANQTGGNISELAIQYTGEQWRLGATGRADRLDFAFSVDAISLNTGTWINFDALDFASPVTTGATGALDGNAVASEMLLSSSLSGLSIVNGSNVWLRWSDFDATGSDDGLAIDNFSIKAVQVQAAPAPSVPDHLPFGAFIGALGGLLWFGSRHGQLQARAVRAD